MAGIALFGGTFDPVHNGHLTIAREAANRFDFARILFIPAANPPHKVRGAAAPYEDRFRMVELACQAGHRFEPSRIEEGTTKSYSIETVERLKASGVEPLAFLIGADAFAEIRTWHRWPDLIHEVEFVVVGRPGAEYAIPPGARVRRLDGLHLAISSSDIRAALSRPEVREKIARGEYEIPVPPAVLRYIVERGLYRSQAS